MRQDVYARFCRRLTSLLVVGVLVAAGCGGGTGEVSVPATTSLVKNAVLTTSTSVPATTTTAQASTTTTQVPATTTQAPITTTTTQAPTTTAATTSTLSTVSTVEIELVDASAEVEEVTISLEAEVHIQVGGFKPFSEVTIELYSEPVELVVAVADADGWIDVTATIPVETDVGDHEIHIDGVDASDEPVEILIPAEIVEAAPTVTEPPPTTTAAPTTTAVPTTTVQASTTTAATTSTLPTVSTVEIELADASAEVEEVTISLEAEVHIQVGGFKPFSEVTIELYSEPVELVVAVADADGWIEIGRASCRERV